MEMILEIEPPFLVVKPGLSETDFYRLASEDSDWEYIDGRVVMHSPASIGHERLFRFLINLIDSYLARKGGAEVIGSRYPMRLDRRWSPEPDLIVVRDRSRRRIREQRLEGPADLVIEIVSPSDSHLVYKEKLGRYREAGIPEIWIVDPLQREVLADRDAGKEREKEILKAGRLASTVVPGFWIDVRWLWRNKLPPPHACLDKILA